MGLLAPLYALAALAIIGPILFHLIQRQPRGQFQFSSLMFLTPSAPRLTRRSRLDNWLLLLLRALAIALIAFAFARPYLRQESFLNASLPGRNILVLFDTSGSMQREDVWQSSLRALEQLIDSLSPEDRLALYSVDDKVLPLVPLDSDTANTPAMSVQAVKAAMAELRPTWKRTRLAEGLRTVADLMSTAALTGQIDAGAENEIVLISDLHADSSLESLQGFPWPESIQLDVRQSLPQTVGNARASLMAADPEADDGEADDKAGTQGLKVRVENNANSPQQTFQLMWASPSAPYPQTATTVQVPAGQVRVLPTPPRPPGATRLELSGDGWAGDNAVFVAESSRTVERIAFVGTNPSQPEEQLSYFLKKAPLDTALARREVFEARVEQLDFADPLLKTIVIEPETADVVTTGELRTFTEAGGSVIVCLARPNANLQNAAEFISALTDQVGVELTEADVAKFSLLSAIDYSHPVFAPFADPRFNDFSKLRFWSHRKLVFDAEQPQLRTIASYDDLTPMLLEARVGQGRVWILTTGWQPTASSLALSSKFVPILMGILAPSAQALSVQRSYEVGERIAIPDVTGEVALFREDGSELDDSAAEVRDGRVAFFEPGLFKVQTGDFAGMFAVQVPASESQLLPLDIDVFEQYGIKLGKVAADGDRSEALRQLQVEELEGKQRLWQWLIAAGIAVLGLETLLAGVFARRTAPATSPS